MGRLSLRSFGAEYSTDIIELFPMVPRYRTAFRSLYRNLRIISEATRAERRYFLKLLGKLTQVPLSFFSLGTARGICFALKLGGVECFDCGGVWLEGTGKGSFQLLDRLIIWRQGPNR